MGLARPPFGFDIVLSKQNYCLSARANIGVSSAVFGKALWARLTRPKIGPEVMFLGGPRGSGRRNPPRKVGGRRLTVVNALGYRSEILIP